MKVKKYNNLNGIRTLLCIGIIIFHININSNFIISKNINSVLNDFVNFVFIFMIISSFSMCCGYYEKIRKREIFMDDFYKKRINKILPFFFVL